MSIAGNLQNAANANANEYAKQLQVFVDLLKNYTGVTVSAAAGSVPNTIDVSSVQTALTELMAGAQLTPGAPLPIDSLPAITVRPLGTPVVGAAPPTITHITAPVVTPSTAPKVGKASFQGKAPSLTFPKPAVRPTTSIPATPQFGNVHIPTITDIDIPHLTAVAPVSTLNEPTNLFSFSEVAYQSALLDGAKAKLLSDLANGGYGIETADELALWSRARERELRGTDATMNEASRQTAARGFSLPPGALLAQLQSAIQSGAERISTVSRDIALKRADMYVEHRKFTFVQIKELEQLSVNIHMSVMERALNTSKAVAEFGVALYNAQATKFNTMIESFKSGLAAYDSQVRGALGQLEAQKIKLQVVSTEVDIQKNQAQLYNAQVEGQKTLMDMYRADVAAMQGLADVERLKLDAFKTEVEVYSETLRAGTLQLQGYEAQIRGDLASAEIYKTQVSAQMTQAEIAKAQASITESNARIVIENVRAEIAVASARADVYRAQTQGVSASNEATARAFAARTEAFRAVGATYDAMGKLDISQFDAASRVSVENVKLNLEQGRLLWDIKTKAATVGADAIGKAMQGSLNQVIAIASTDASS